MNNTAYNPLKKLLVMSIVLFAGTSAMAQQAAGSETPATQPAFQKASPAVKQDKAIPATNPAQNLTAKPDTKATGTLNNTRKGSASVSTTAGNTTVKQNNGNVAQKGNAATAKQNKKSPSTVQAKIARIDAMLAKPGLSEARRKHLTTARENLLKGQGATEQKK